MALTFKLEGDILEVRQELYGAGATRISHWYYDIKRWMVSSFGKNGDQPDRHMTASQILWVRRHYLPKVQP